MPYIVLSWSVHECRARWLVCKTECYSGPVSIRMVERERPLSCRQTHLPRMALALAYKAFPCADFPPTAQKPLMPSALRACFTASPHFFKGLLANAALARAEAALLTIFPDLLLTKVAFVKPPTVLAFLPLKTAGFAALPRAMMLTFFTFMAFFIEAAAFIAFMPFIAGLRAAFIARAITNKTE